MKKITYIDPVTSTVLWVNKIFKGKVTICGSFGLSVNGLLNRPVHDIDCITDENWYRKNPFDFLGEEYENCYFDAQGSSAKFYVNGVLVKVFKLISPFGVTVDVMYRNDNVESELCEFYGVPIKVESPQSAIEVKKYYIANWEKMEVATGGSVNKHTDDIEYYLSKL